MWVCFGCDCAKLGTGAGKRLSPAQCSGRKVRRLGTAGANGIIPKCTGLPKQRWILARRTKAFSARARWVEEACSSLWAWSLFPKKKKKKARVKEPVKLGETTSWLNSSGIGSVCMNHSPLRGVSYPQLKDVVLLISMTVPMLHVDLPMSNIFIWTSRMNPWDKCET